MLLKLFAGILITSEIRMHLQASILWKEAQILKDFSDNHLEEVYFQEAKYVGKFLPKNSINIKELRSQEKMIFEKLSEYCPKLNIDKLKIKIFSQQFIT